MTAVEYISDSEVIVKASWSNFEHNGVAAFKLSERSPLPPAVSAKDFPGGRNQVLNAHQIQRTDPHAAESDEASALESIVDTENLLHWNHHSDNPNVTKADYAADNESDIEQDNAIEDLESPEQRDVNAT